MLRPFFSENTCKGHKRSQQPAQVQQCAGCAGPVPQSSRSCVVPQHGLTAARIILLLLHINSLQATSCSLTSLPSSPPMLAPSLIVASGAMEHVSEACRQGHAHTLTAWVLPTPANSLPLHALAEPPAGAHSQSNPPVTARKRSPGGRADVSTTHRSHHRQQDVGSHQSRVVVQPALEGRCWPLLACLAVSHNSPSLPPSPSAACPPMSA